VVVPGQIYNLSSDGSVLKYRQQRAALGSGTRVAMGAMYALDSVVDFMGAGMGNAALMRLQAEVGVKAAIGLEPDCAGDVEALEVPCLRT